MWILVKLSEADRNTTRDRVGVREDEDEKSGRGRKETERIEIKEVY